jgi:hypothetical protein
MTSSEAVSETSACQRIGIVVRRGDSDSDALRPPPPSSRTPSAHTNTIIGLGEDFIDQLRLTRPWIRGPLPPEVTARDSTDMATCTPIPPQAKYTASCSPVPPTTIAAIVLTSSEALEQMAPPGSDAILLRAQIRLHLGNIARELGQLTIDVVDAVERWLRGAPQVHG